MPDVKPAHAWTDEERHDMAVLIVDPATNGGDVVGLSALDVTPGLTPETPAWGVWLNGRAVFLVGLMPYDGVRGVLHLAGTRALDHDQHLALVRGFMSCYPTVEINTLTKRPALARLARQVGFRQIGQNGDTLLLRAT